jgi:hypothetical protein
MRYGFLVRNILIVHQSVFKFSAGGFPNIIESVKGYAKHEKEVFENVTKARSALMSADTPDSKAKANAMMSGALKSLFAVAENYPQLKSNETVSKLMDELSGTENRVSVERKRFNDQITEYNISVIKFPSRSSKLERTRSPMLTGKSRLSTELKASRPIP